MFTQQSSIFKIHTTKYIHNFSYAKILSENAIRKVSQYYCVHTWFSYYKILREWCHWEQIKIEFTYPGVLPSALIIELELIHVYHTVGIHLLWKSCDIRPVSMAKWNRGLCLPLLCSVIRLPLCWNVYMRSCS
jgi:hypothetical protein